MPTEQLIICQYKRVQGSRKFSGLVRNTREGNVLTRVCESVHTCVGGVAPSQVWGVLHPRYGWGVPHPRSGVGGATPARSGWWGGVPHPWGEEGVPWPCLDGGGYLSDVWMGGTLARSGWWEVARPHLDGGGGTPARSGWWGVPALPHHDWMGYPPSPP